MNNIFEKSFSIRQPRDTNLIRWCKNEVQVDTYDGYIDEKRVFIIHLKRNNYSDFIGFYMTVMFGNILRSIF